MDTGLRVETHPHETKRIIDSTNVFIMKYITNVHQCDGIEPGTLFTIDNELAFFDFPHGTVIWLRGTFLIIGVELVKQDDMFDNGLHSSMIVVHDGRIYLRYNYFRKRTDQ